MTHVYAVFFLPCGTERHFRRIFTQVFSNWQFISSSKNDKKRQDHINKIVHTAYALYSKSCEVILLICVSNKLKLFMPFYWTVNCDRIESVSWELDRSDLLTIPSGLLSFYQLYQGELPLNNILSSLCFPHKAVIWLQNTCRHKSE